MLPSINLYFYQILDRNKLTSCVYFYDRLPNLSSRFEIISKFTGIYNIVDVLGWLDLAFRDLDPGLFE